MTAKPEGMGGLQSAVDTYMPWRRRRSNREIVDEALEALRADLAEIFTATLGNTRTSSPGDMNDE